MKKVSIIVPVYNSQEYLKACAESLVNQTLEDIEIVFVNDGSTDNSLSILQEYQERFPEKVVLRTKENGGQASARNLGIEICTGEYIGFVDSDDCVDTTMFEKLYNVAVAKDCDLVECNYKYLQITEQGETLELPPYGNVRAYENNADMFIDPLVSPWNKIYKASIFKNNTIEFPEGLIYEDTAFFIKTIPYIKEAAYVSEAFVYHFLRQNSTMNAKRDLRVGNIFPVLNDIIEFYQKMGFYECYKKELEYFCVKILLCSSLNRIALVSDKKLRLQFVKKTLEMIATYFSGYRKNDYFRKNVIGVYMKCINRITIYPIVGLLRLKSK